MFEVRVHKKTTLRMIEDYVNSSRKLFDLLHSERNRFSPLSWWREWNKRKLEGRIIQLDAALAGRYKGLLVQMFERSSISAVDYGEKVDAIYEVLRDKVLQLVYLKFPPSFWNICVVETAGGHHLKPLIHKFMIRPFVDEISSLPERDALLTRAYQDTTRPRPTDEEFEAVIANACTLLHQAMQGNKHVSILTGGVFTPELLNAITSPLEQYTYWLFRA